MSEPSAKERAARMQAEHRAIVQATIQAKRSGKLGSPPPDNSAAEAITGIFVAVVVIGLLILVARFGN